MKTFLIFSVTLAMAGRLLAAAGLASSAAQATATASGHSFNPTFSADGNYLLFVSQANNLVPNDNLNPWLDVFVRNLVASNTALVSVNTSGTGGANADATYPTISSNGQLVVFASYASNLIPGVTNGAKQIFLRDLIAQTTTLVSTGGVFGGAAESGADFPQISQNGNWVVFESHSWNLAPEIANGGGLNVYARDLQNRSNIVVSIIATGSAANNGSNEKSYGPVITPTGRHVAFLSTALNLLPSFPWPQSSLGDVYVRDLISKTTSWVSVNVPSFFNGFYYRCSVPAISDDGRYVAFAATSDGFAAPYIFRHDRQTGSTLTITSAATNLQHGLQISSDGRFVLFEEMDGTSSRVRLWDAQLTNSTSFSCGGNDGRGNAAMNSAGTDVAFIGCSNVFVLGTNTSGVATRVSINTKGSPSVGDYQFVTPALSLTGTRVAFATTASDLANNDFNGASDIFVHDVNTGVTELITNPVLLKQAATAFTHSFLGLNSVSADGRFVVSTRYDDPSAYRDTNSWADVFVSDTLNGKSLAVSINTNLYYTNTDAGSGNMTVIFIDNTNVYRNPIISADGSMVMAVRLASFGSYAAIFGTTLTNGLFNSQSLSLVTRSQNSTPVSANVDSPSLSADGKLLAFRSDDSQYAFDFIPDSNGYSDVWLRYPRIREYHPFIPLTNYTLLSGNGNANGPSIAPVITADGGRVLFATRAGNLPRLPAGGSSGQYANYQIVTALVGTNNFPTNVLYNLPLRLCSYTISFQQYDWTDAYDTNIRHTNRNAILTPMPVDITNAIFSANNRFVVYAHADGSAIWRHDFSKTQTNFTYVSQAPYPNQAGSIVATNLVPAEANTLVCTNCRNPSVSADGNVVTYERVRTFSSIVDLFAKDFRDGTETLVSANLTGAPANGTSASPLLSSDGRYVVFQSKAGNLIGTDTNGATDVFVRDRWQGVTMLVSANAQGGPGNGPSTRPVMAADGRTVVFQSFASDLVTGDYNDKRDIFVLKLCGADTDGDGMDDDWEAAYFSNLARDGSGDFDSDGASDLQEFRAGTDPTNEQSVFRVLTVTPAGGSSRLVLWSGHSTRSYRVDYKDDVNAANWSSLNGAISWNGSTASTTDNSPATNRYYRVVRLP